MSAIKNNPTFAGKVHLRRKILLFIFVLSMFPLFSISKALFTTLAQTIDKKEKEVKKAFFPSEPIEIVSVGNSKTLVKFGEKFTQETDWLKDFTVEIKNKFDKRINYVRLELDFPETASSGNIMTFPLSYGVRPGTISKDGKVEAVQRGKNIKLTFTEKNYQKLKSFIETRHLLDNLKQIDIRIVFVRFEDGTGWSNGILVRPDPNDSKRFVPIDSTDLRGSKDEKH